LNTRKNTESKEEFATMKRRTRKLIGTIIILVFALAYLPFAMALAESRIVELPVWLQTVLYVPLGLAWIIPVMPLIRWMERPDSDENNA